MEVFDIFLLEAILNGLLLGGLLALLSLGLNLVFGVIDVVWICYAKLIMCGMYCVYYLHVQYHWPLVLAMLAAIGVVAFLGYILHQFVIRPVLSVDPARIFAITSALGGAFAGLAACLLVLQYDVHPAIGLSFGPITFLICVLGGLGNMVGGFIAAFIFAQFIAVGGFFFAVEWGYVIAFAFFIAVMFWRPRGIFGK